MFKLVVLCACLAAAAAEPNQLASLAYTSSAIAPLAYSGAYAPAATYISPASSIFQPAVYSTPYGYSHLIKKRSAPFAYNGYIAPTTYLASTYAAPYAPYLSSGAILPSASIAYSTPAHFIKKRSAPIAYVQRSYSAPISYVPTTYSAPLYTTPYLSTANLAYPAHYIKKRSVALAYAAPAAFSHQSRIDYNAYSTPALSAYASIGPLNYYPTAIHSL
ncbi:uncharacterized protein [Epargyreus clarus]|uniref:uncharacterized protein n=1 Tax=Epargyreus clarus TaxID=520877 RepID=UPI003C2CA544